MIRDNFKFTAIIFENFSHEIDKIMQIGDSIQIYPNNPIEFPEHWKQTLGEFDSESITNSNLCIVKTMSSDKLGVLDEENKSLTEDIELLTRSIWLYNVPFYREAFRISGSRENGKYSIRQFGKITCYKRNTYYPSYCFNEQDFINCNTLANTLTSIYSSVEYNRFKRGLFAFIKAISEADFEFRFHQFVRAIEALLIPEINKTTKQFKERCQTFIYTNGETTNFLEEVYKIRCVIEHLNDIESAIKKLHKGTLLDHLQLRVRQVEFLARNTYKYILTNQDVLKIFINDDRIRSFWNTDENERRKIWTNLINIKNMENGVFEL